MKRYFTKNIWISSHFGNRIHKTSVFAHSPNAHRRIRQNPAFDYSIKDKATVSP